MYLLDTHVLLWWLTEPEKIAATARQMIANRNNAIFVSSVSFWEMAIKNSLGKLTLPNNILSISKSEGFKILPLTPEEGLSVANLPPIHQDPFDRILIAQAKYNNLALLTHDKIIQTYPIATVLS